jgi:hypothetical protein
MAVKPGHVFDRDREWAGLTRFAANPHRGALLGVVSGRRRQGKSFLLEALTSATVSLGEVKWGEVMGRKHVDRLARARDLLSASFDTNDCVLTCYSATGFSKELQGEEETSLVLVTLDDIYSVGA